MKYKNLSKKIIQAVKSKGFNYVELPSVIETNLILQRSGENFRKYLFLLIIQREKNLLLIQTLSLSAILDYAKAKSLKREKIFYSGNAFRKSYNKKKTVY